MMSYQTSMNGSSPTHRSRSSGGGKPLRKWIESEAKKQLTSQQFSVNVGISSSSAAATPFGAPAANKNEHERKGVLLRKTTVAYGIAELLRHVRDNKNSSAGKMDDSTGDAPSSSSHLSKRMTWLAEQCGISNFFVSTDPANNSAPSSSSNNISARNIAWNNIKSVSMNSPNPLSVGIIEPSFLMGGFDDSGSSASGSTSSSARNEHHDDMGKYLEVEFSSLIDLSNESTAAVADAAAHLMDLIDKTKGGGDSSSEEVAAKDEQEESIRCHLLGILFYELYSHLSPFPGGSVNTDSIGRGEPALKRAKMLASSSIAQDAPSAASASSSSQQAGVPGNGSASSIPGIGGGQQQGELLLNPLQNANYVPLIELGFPSSISMLVQNLLECGTSGGNGSTAAAATAATAAEDGDENTTKRKETQDAYKSLDAVCNDLHLLLLDPNRFLFDRTAVDNVAPHSSSTTPPSNNQQGGDETANATQPQSQTTTTTTSFQQLRFRKHKLYGRENQVSLITDAFCRVSGGNSEAFFIGGFSGSGKSMLVNSLTARVNCADGYVLTHKFDQMTKEPPLLEVISVFNDLCLRFKERCSNRDLSEIVKNLMNAFGTDFSVLANLLPNIEAICPQVRNNHSSYTAEKESGNQMNLRSVCFTLQRFMRVVSSKLHPVMLFLDDLQWCDNSALTVIEGILSDITGSSCLFFVGSYRNNEVKDDHSVFSLMKSVRMSGVPVTKLGLEGLGQEDLNTLISDAMCMFPRLCMPLSDIIFQKTKGNPFFVLEFLRSLVDGGLLQYSTEKHRWIWDEDRINSMDIAGNVLYLLSSKMSRMSKNVQSALKVAACFGIKMKQSVVGILSDSSEYSDICDGLDQAVKEGFMDKLGVSDFKFVHDKVQEAAYSLLPDDEKKQYHYELGMTLHSLTEGSDVDDIIFSIADQINHGIDNIPAHKSNVRIALAKVNKLAGAKAVELSDFATARSYLNVALSLLPSGHWQSHYDMSLQLSTLLAKSCYSCGDANKARCILQEILEESSCIEDKLPAYFLLVTVLNSCGKGMDAYTTCHEILCQLGEKIPQSMGGKETNELVESTSKMAEIITDNTLIEMEEMDDKTSIVLKFYTLMSTVAFFARPDMLPYLSCKTVDLTLKHGMCKYSLMGLIQFALVLCGNKLAMDIPGSSRIGNAVVSCLKNRYPSAVDQLPRVYFSYYGLVAFHTETLQSCTDMIRQGFDVGMSTGDSDTAFFCAIHHIKMSLFGGEQLFTLLERVDYYLELADQYKNELAKSYLSIYRDTISTLIDKGEVTGSKKHAPTEAMSNPSKSLSATIYFHRAIQAYWLGHSERCHHYIGKFLQLSTLTRLNTVVVTFIHGLNSFQVLKRQNTAKLRAIPKNAIVSLKTATSHSRWNFRNKVHLLEAENFSCHSNHEEAKASYAAAITSARCSRFLHEQGLACELAGIHYQKIGDHRSAWSFFNQAKQCYAEWGSQLKVDAINRQLGSIQVPLSNGNL